MKNILKKAIIFSTFVSEQIYKEETIYRFAKYVAILEYKNNYLLLNTLSREMISLEREEYTDILSNKVSDNYLYLLNSYFIVPNEFDDVKFSEQILSLSKCLDRSDAITDYVILPTLKCNARCFYCFEHGSTRYSMTKKTAIDVADFIVKKSKGKKIFIKWFGGEPLLNIEAIDTMVEIFKKNNIKYNSSMITNGYLFDENIVLKAKNFWKTNTVQITLDGTEEIYNKTKNYIYNDEINPFEKVINNIELLAKNEINVLIRLNLDKHNESDLNNLIEYLFERFKNHKKYVSIYLWLLYDNRGITKNIRDTVERHYLTEKLIELENKIEENGFALKGGPVKYIRVRACLAESDATAVILPNGNLGKCDHHSDDEIYGNIYSDKIDLNIYNSWKIQRKKTDLCHSCPLLPECHYLQKCPDNGAYDCDEFLQKQRLSALYRKMRFAYNKSLEEEK